MTKEEWRIYNNEKQKLYRFVKRGGPPRKYTKTIFFIQRFTPVEEILKSAGHCGYCGLLLSHEWHDKHPLVGCMRHIEAYKKSLR